MNITNGGLVFDDRVAQTKAVRLGLSSANFNFRMMQNTPSSYEDEEAAKDEGGDDAADAADGGVW
ncbi:hypothetical protein PG985_014252 [Apiospora marii]|uniref:Uncharacterized protein n=1 Tax=Apiospora marii TaxID=335849 RepID=A0ABR1R5U5_9PEZI